MLKFTALNIERLDKYLAKAAKKSRGAVQKAIKAGQVTINGRPVTEPDHHLRLNDIIESPEFPEYEIVPTEMDLNVVYEDGDMAVIDKPPGLVVHPGAGKTVDTLTHALLFKFPQIKDVGEKHRPGIVHRLDEDTSGLILIAKTPAAYDYLKELFKNRKVEKEYLALVHGVPEKLHDIIDKPLAQNFTQRKMSVGTGKPAITEYVVLTESKPGVDQVALIKVNLHTGRTHQIRAHMAHIGHPLVGDKLYGGKFKDSDYQILPRQFLHAFRLKFQKMDGTWMELNSPLPPDLQATLQHFKITYKN